MLKNWTIALSLIFFSLHTFAQLPGSSGMLVLNSADDRCSITNASALHSATNVTVEAWINASSWAPNSWQNVIVSKDGWANNIEAGYSLRCGANGRLSFNLGTADGWVEAISAPLMSVGQWYHVAGTFDGNTIRVYINGQEVGSQNYAGSIVLGNYDFTVGQITFANGGNRNFNGFIDEVRFWNTTRTQAELRADMCQKLTEEHPQYNNLQLNLSFSEGDGETTTDSSINGFNATLVNTTWSNSGAPIGDTSVYDYSANLSNLSLTAQDGGMYEASGFDSAVNGAHLYIVNEAPVALNTTLDGTFEPNQYVGVFFAALENTNFTLDYNYTALAELSENADEQDMRLVRRQSGQQNLWQIATTAGAVDIDENAVQVCSTQGRGEFALGFGANGAFDTTQSLCNGEGVWVQDTFYDEPGEYNFSFIGSNGCDSTFTLILTDGGGFFEESDFVLCPGNTLEFGGQTISTAGLYENVMQTSTGCDSTLALNVAIGEIYEMEQDRTICPDEILELGDQTINSPGFYTVLLQSQFGCDSTLLLTVDEQAIQTSLSLSGGGTTLSVLDQEGASYQWVDCSDDFAPIPDATGNVFVPQSNGVYAAEITINGCTDRSFCQDMVVGVSEIALQEIYVFPNPSAGKFTIQLDQTFQNATVAIVDMVGKTVFSAQFQDTRNIIIQEDLPAGAYQLLIKTDGQTLQKSILVR